MEVNFYRRVEFIIVYANYTKDEVGFKNHFFDNGINGRKGSVCPKQFNL